MAPAVAPMAAPRRPPTAPPMIAPRTALWPKDSLEGSIAASVSRISSGESFRIRGFLSSIDRFCRSVRNQLAPPRRGVARIEAAIGIRARSGGQALRTRGELAIARKAPVTTSQAVPILRGSLGCRRECEGRKGGEQYQHRNRAMHFDLPERFRAKWIPARIKKTRQDKNPEPVPTPSDRKRL